MLLEQSQVEVVQVFRLAEVVGNLLGEEAEVAYHQLQVKVVGVEDLPYQAAAVEVAGPPCQAAAAAAAAVDRLLPWMEVEVVQVAVEALQQNQAAVAVAVVAGRRHQQHQQ